MNDEELRRLLQNSLADRRAPAALRDRVLAGLQARPWKLAAAAALLILAAAGALLVPRQGALPEHVRLAFEQHERSDVKEHAIASMTPRQMTEAIREATGRELVLPGLRDAGFGQLDAHRCTATGAAHVIYQNSWNKLSCFIYEADKFPLPAGERIGNGSIEGVVFRQGEATAVAIREGGIVKLWVSELKAPQVSLIALDAERKRYALKTTVLTAATAEAFRPMGEVLDGVLGVEDVQEQTARLEWHVRYDPQRVSSDEIVAKLVLGGWDVNAQEGEGGK
jgi:hypothetical protein